MLALQEYTLDSVANVLNASYSGDSVGFTAVTTDTRSLQAGELFLALKGPSFDGHDYVGQAMEKGAVGAIVDHELELPIPQIKVENTLDALGVMASARRLAFNGKVVGLTGSNGKTTVKELIASILRLKGKILATQGNLNNDIGLPLTLLQLENDELFAVVEMGANHHGEISYLTNIAHPDVAIITNAGAAHLEGFGSVEGVANAKSEIYQGLSADGIAVINADDRYAELWREKTTDHKQICFAIESENAEVTAFDIKTGPEKTEFKLEVAGESEIVNLPLGGIHNVSNALAAAAAATAVGIDILTIKQGLESFAGVKGRQNAKSLESGATLIDDAYNANLDSVKAGINVLSSYEGLKVLVIGDLFEVGDDSQSIHAQIGEYAKAHAIDELLAVGDMSQYAVKSFGDGAVHFEDKQTLAKCLKPKLKENVVVLVKGSRGMRMEEVIDVVS